MKTYDFSVVQSTLDEINAVHDLSMFNEDGERTKNLWFTTYSPKKKMFIIFLTLLKMLSKIISKEYLLIRTAGMKAEYFPSLRIWKTVLVLRFLSTMLLVL